MYYSAVVLYLEQASKCGAPSEQSNVWLTQPRGKPLAACPSTTGSRKPGKRRREDHPLPHGIDDLSVVAMHARTKSKVRYTSDPAGNGGTRKGEGTSW
jgi:hypothetical protein